MFSENWKWIKIAIQRKKKNIIRIESWKEISMIKMAFSAKATMREEDIKMTKGGCKKIWKKKPPSRSGYDSDCDWK